jgi:Putative DNA-binding domain
MGFNPFEKRIEELVQDDLQKLIEKEVSEGYFVEYKSDIPTAAKIAKSIASFANTYGGWLIVGVSTNDDNVPCEIGGIDRAIHGDPLSKIRDAIKAHVDPVPVFWIRSIDRDDGRVVLIVHVPDAQEMPFIHSDGRVYRRVHDASGPVPETDRYALDRIVDQGRRSVEKFKEFCRDERKFSESEDDLGWLNVYISPYPPWEVDRMEILSSGEIKKLLEVSQKPLLLIKGKSDQDRITGNVPLNAGQTGHRSVLLRQTATERLPFNVVSAEFFLDGRAKLHVPLSTAWPDKITSAKVTEVLKEIFFEGSKGNIKRLRLFDIGMLWLTLTCLLTYYRDWLGNAVAIDHFRVALTIKNVWRFVPFCDSDDWADFVKNYGLPVVNRSSIEMPEGIGSGMMIKEIGENMGIWGFICSLASMGVGLPLDTTGALLSETLMKAGMKKAHDDGAQ